MRYTSLPALAAVIMTTIACADNPVAPSVSPLAALGTSSSVVTIPTSGPWAKIVEGETGPGSLYALYIPANWNGDAVYYAHGIRPPEPFAPIALNDQDNFFQVRDALGALGYAFAYSSFSENGLAVKDGAQRTHQLRGLLNAHLPAPAHRSYLAGYSLGALVAVELAEQFPTQYDGVLAMCGMVGGTPRQLQYVGDVRALFDAYYPGVLPGDVISVPSTPLTPAQVQAVVVPAIAANPLGLFAIASTAQTPLAFAPIGSLADRNSVASRRLSPRDIRRPRSSSTTCTRCMMSSPIFWPIPKFLRIASVPRSFARGSISRSDLVRDHARGVDGDGADDGYRKHGRTRCQVSPSLANSDDCTRAVRSGSNEEHGGDGWNEDGLVIVSRSRGHGRYGPLQNAGNEPGSGGVPHCSGESRRHEHGQGFHGQGRKHGHDANEHGPVDDDANAHADDGGPSHPRTCDA